MNLPSNLTGNSNDETNFSQKLLLTDTHVSKIRKAFPNSVSSNAEFSKSQLSRIVQLGGVLIVSSPLKLGGGGVGGFLFLKFGQRGWS